MTLRRIVEERLASCVSGGLGRWGTEAEADETLGVCIYWVEWDGCWMGVHEKGLRHAGESIFSAQYCDIEGVDLLVLRELVALRGPWATAQLRLRVSDAVCELPMPYVIYSDVGPLVQRIVGEQLWKV
jgi:hypothetical protein